MDVTTTSYEADLDRAYEALTDKHKRILAQLETSLQSYLKTRRVKPVTIQGPYGSGKTQLLYHLFKYVWNNGGIAIYTHLERLIPETEMGSLDYSVYLNQIVDSEIASLRTGNSNLMIGRVKESAIESIKKIATNSAPVVLFIDELEQKYRLLDDKVKTDDHSPFKEAIRLVERGESRFCLVLAFAPVSFYEFSRGEAQTGSFTPYILPVIEPVTFRNQLGDMRNIGNFAWWMGKGRCRGIIRILDIFHNNVSDITAMSRKEVKDICDNIGPIGNVPPLNFECVEAIGDFPKFINYLTNLRPLKSGEELYSDGIAIVKKCRICGPAHNLSSIIEQALRSCKVNNTDISYYVSLVLDGLSGADGSWPLFTDKDDWKELFNMVGDLILEFEGPEQLPSHDLEKLQNDPDFIFNIRTSVHNVSTPEEGYCLSPSFLRTLFPFPISSPNLTSSDIRMQRENLGNETYLATEEINGVSLYFFLNTGKAREFLLQESKDFIKENRSFMAVNLGSKEEFEVPKLAKWLQNEGRFKLVTLPGIYSDFLVSFLYLTKTDNAGLIPLSALFAKLADRQSSANKDRRRKIVYYSTRIKEFLSILVLPVPQAKYKLIDETNYDTKIGFAAPVMGFAFTDKKDWQVIHKFRQEFEATDFIKSESKKRETGVPTALDSLVIESKQARDVSIGGMLRRIKDSFDSYLPNLEAISNDLTKEEFIGIAAEDKFSRIMEGIYLYLREWKDHTKSIVKFNEEKSKWDGLIKRLDILATKIQELHNLSDRQISLTHSLQNDQVNIANILKLLNENQKEISPYARFLLATLAEKTREVAEKQLNVIEKNLSTFVGAVEPELKMYAQNLKSAKTSDDETFTWIGRGKAQVFQEFTSRFTAACQKLSKNGRVDLENPPDNSLFKDAVRPLTDELHTLSDINTNLILCLKKANEINDKLRAGA